MRNPRPRKPNIKLAQNDYSSHKVVVEITLAIELAKLESKSQIYYLLLHD